MIPQRVIKEIKERCDIRDHIMGADRTTGKCYVDCPNCGQKKGKSKGLMITAQGGEKKYANKAHCFSCGFHLSDAIDAEMKIAGCDFITAVKRCAATANINIPEEKSEKTDRRHSSEEPVLRHESFADLQLKASGLREADTLARRYDGDGNVVEEGVKVFVSGGVTGGWVYTPYEDEMVIRYLDLFGNPQTFATRGAAGRPKPYYRVRYQNPEAHVGKNGRPMKYQSPAGAQVAVMIPEYIRERFHRREEIPTLVIQEGEKKAEKACKHGVPSLGIQGIYNIGNAEQGLIKEIQRIIKECKVQNVVLMLDADWDDLASDIKPGDKVDSRPRQFAGAVIKFKQYMKTLHSMNLSVDVWFGHVNRSSEHDAKGVDDLLVGPLKGSEQILMQDILGAMNSHDGHGDWCDVLKVSGMSDFKIQDLWHLNDNSAFFKHHRDRLADIPYFKINGVRVKPHGDAVVLDTDSGEFEKFWEVTVKRQKDDSDDEPERKVSFKTIPCFQFLEANGFRKVRTDQGFDIIRAEDGYIEVSSEMDLRDFVCDYVHREAKDAAVREYFMNKRTTILGHDRLENLKLIDPTIIYEKWEQWYHFADSKVKVTPNDIADQTDAPLAWRSVRLKRPFERIPIIKDITFSKDTGWRIDYTEDARDCEFLQFLINTSNFWWKPSEAPAFDSREHLQHVVNKITSLGYLAIDHKDRNESKAIIAMDAKMSEVGTNNGRSGKSLIGQALKALRNCAFINGRGDDAQGSFMYHEVRRETRVVWIDDIKQRFDFTALFADITGDLLVNLKGGSRFTMEFEQSPKFYITTNHTIQNLDDSCKGRINFMSFSDFYNAHHQPTDDFGHLFFDGWDAYQWKLFDNFMLDCIMMYMRISREGYVKAGWGLVPPPMEDIEARTLRQEIGEVFVQWADIYFTPDSPGLNSRQQKKTLYDAFLTANPTSARFTSSADFGKKLRKWCQFRGFHYNITRRNKDSGLPYRDHKAKFPGQAFVGDADKSAGQEYITVCTTEYADSQPLI